ncbi:hypothetical protein SDC9_182532 [bioreactor metagenome]|uniref:Uncharacterized protein n=1 Tax=bioreactor metagenome TaxID=1076179 RepID=A0A645H7T2_9ZZZZ
MVSSMKQKPESKTPVKANCQECPIAITTLKAKKLFNPIPGAWAIGTLAMSAIKMVPAIAATAVVVNSAPLSIPVSPNI